jgi:hypothetical protein
MYWYAPVFRILSEALRRHACPAKLQERACLWGPIKSEVQKESNRKFRIERPNKKKRAKVSRDDMRYFALETVVPIGEAVIRRGWI